MKPLNLVKLQDIKSVHRNHLHLYYTNNETSGKKKKNHYPIHYTFRNNKILGINFFFILFSHCTARGSGYP